MILLMEMQRRCWSNSSITFCSAQVTRSPSFTSKRVIRVNIYLKCPKQHHDSLEKFKPCSLFNTDGSSLTVEEIWLNIPDVYKCQQQTSFSSLEQESGLEGNLTYSQFGNVITQVVYNTSHLASPYF